MNMQEFLNQIEIRRGILQNAYDKTADREIRFQLSTRLDELSEIEELLKKADAQSRRGCCEGMEQ